MSAPALTFDTRPQLHAGRLVVALTGWMDGGDVSTGTVRWLIGQLKAREIARIDPNGFYIESFPGNMEIAALFRPYVKTEDGLIQSLEGASGVFYADPTHDLALFVGREPNLRWPSFADCILEFAQQTGIDTILFVGSFGGGVPHTREPRLYGTVSDPGLKDVLRQHGVRLSNYEGPAGFATYLMTRAAAAKLRMISLAAEIPGYVTGTNPMSIEAVARRVVVILGLHLDVSPLRQASNEWEAKITAAVARKPDLTKHIRKLETRYDDELIDTPIGNPKEWFGDEEIKLD